MKESQHPSLSLLFPKAASSDEFGDSSASHEGDQYSLNILHHVRDREDSLTRKVYHVNNELSGTYTFDVVNHRQDVSERCAHVEDGGREQHIPFLSRCFRAFRQFLGSTWKRVWRLGRNEQNI